MQIMSSPIPMATPAPTLRIDVTFQGQDEGSGEAVLEPGAEATIEVSVQKCDDVTSTECYPATSDIEVRLFQQ